MSEAPPLSHGAPESAPVADHAGGVRMDFSTAPDQSLVDFASVNQAALAVLPALLRRWLSDGEIEGAEYVALNPTRDDANPGSFKINLDTGRWGEFALGEEAEGGDVVSLLAYLTKTGQPEAARRLSDMLAGQPAPEDDGMFAPLSEDELGATPDVVRATNGKSDKTPIIPVPGDAPPIQFRYPPTRAWAYRDAEDRLVGWIARFDSTDAQGNPQKKILPFTFCQLPDGRQEWEAKGIPAPRPLYRLPEILSRPDAPLLITEGEKTADAGQQLFPGCVATTPMHGAKSPHKTDWSHMAGRKVIIAADQDDAGRAYAERAAKLCRDAGAAEVSRLDFPAHLVIRNGVPTQRDGDTPKGWDLADAIGDGWTPEHVYRGVKDGTIKLTPFEAPASGDAIGADDWPEPMDLLGQTIEAPPPFTMEFLPGAFRRFVAERAEQMQCPPDYIAIPLVIAAASLIGKQFRMAPKAKDTTWTERSCLWGGLIGDSGVHKSPAFMAALEPVFEFQRKMMKEHQEAVVQHINDTYEAAAAESAWKDACKKAGKDSQPLPERPKEAVKPVEPVEPHLTVDDATVESLVSIMGNADRSLLLCSDELASVFYGHDQYKGTGKGNDRQFFLKCHAGATYKKTRSSGKTIIVDDPCLNIVGGTQPDVVRSFLGKGDRDGMLARFSLLSWPPEPEFEYTDYVADAENSREVKEIMRGLLKLKPADLFIEANRNAGEGMDFAPDPLLRFDEEGQQVFIEWYTKNRKRRLDKTMSSAWKSHLAKYDGLFARLCIVHHLIRVVEGTATSPTRVDAETARQVRGFIDEYLEPHAKRIYRYLGQDPAREGARRIAEWIIETSNLTKFTARTIRQKDWSGLTEQDAVNRALDYLENVAGWTACQEKLSGPRGGRPTTPYHVNPKVRELYGQQDGEATDTGDAASDGTA